jgi:Hemerythrin HHE cation binding domain
MNPIGSRLLKDHAELEEQLQRLAEAASASSPELAAIWNVLEGRLMRHMEVEERFLLPLIEASEGAEVERIRSEHARIRDGVAELGLGIDLHSVREPQIAELLRLLRAHAAHENQALYRSSGDKASTAVHHSISEALKSVMRPAPRSGSPDAKRPRA